jgi:hypothetical protein
MVRRIRRTVPERGVGWKTLMSVHFIEELPGEVPVTNRDANSPRYGAGAMRGCIIKAAPFVKEKKENGAPPKGSNATPVSLCKPECSSNQPERPPIAAIEK